MGMRKLLIILVVVLGMSLGYHVYRRQRADFFYEDGRIEKRHRWSFNGERYELLKDGFRVEGGNFFFYTDEVFGRGYYTYKLRVLGFPVKYRTVNYSHYPKEYCWGFPGIPWKPEWHKGWFDKGRERFRECLPKVELYKKQKGKL